MSATSTILRWRARQRRDVWRSLWLYGPFTAVEARRICRQIGYSAVKAARLIRAHEHDMRRIEADRALTSLRTIHGRATGALLYAHLGVETEQELADLTSAEIRRRHAEMTRKHYRETAAEAKRLADQLGSSPA